MSTSTGQTMDTTMTPAAHTPQQVSERPTGGFTDAALGLMVRLGFGWTAARRQAAFARLVERTGVTLGGGAATDPVIHDPRFCDRVLKYGSIGLGEAYMDGWWDVSDLEGFFRKVCRADVADRMQSSNWGELARTAAATVGNLQRLGRHRQVAREHYDIDNELYEAMVGETMVYSCAYWDDGAKDLDEAQTAKLDLACRKLDLKPGMRVLEVGCGFGSLAYHLATKYGAHVTAVNIAVNQLEFARRRFAHPNVEFLELDYRRVTGTFDRAVSVGMFEHVGHKNHRTYFETVRRTLADDGLFLLHTVGNNVTTRRCDAWIDKYVFPNSVLPSLKQLAPAIEGLFVLEDLHNFGPNSSYAFTFREWLKNCERYWSTVDPNKTRYSERFRRMWRYWQSVSAAWCAERSLQLWHLLLSPGGIPEGTPRYRT